MMKKTLMSQSPIYSSNARMKYTHHESSSVQKKLVTPHHLTEITPKSSGSPTQVAGIEMECTMVDVISHEAMSTGQAQVINISKCPEIPDLGSKSPREDPTVTLSRNSYHSSITYKRRRQQ